jgi:hypothetical protein
MKTYKVQMSDGGSISVEAGSSEAHAMVVAERKMLGSAFGSRAISASCT